MIAIQEEAPPRGTDPVAGDGQVLPWLLLVLAGSMLAHRGAGWLARRIAPPDRPDRSTVEPGILAVSMFLVGAIVAPYFALGFTSAESSPGDRVFASMLTAAGLNLLAAGAATLHARRTQGLSLRALGLSPRGGLAMYGFATLALFSFLPVYLLASLLNAGLLDALQAEGQQEVVRSLLSDDGLRTHPATLLVICVVVPIGEEMIFRGFLQRALRAIIGPFGAILLASGAFALVHDPAAMIPVFVVGICLGLICERTGSIWPAAFAHAIFNTLQMTNVNAQAG